MSVQPKTGTPLNGMGKSSLAFINGVDLPIRKESRYGGNQNQELKAKVVFSFTFKLGC